MRSVRFISSYLETLILRRSSRRGTRSARCHQGFSLIELMVSLGISSMVALVTGGIIVNAAKTMQTANNQTAGSSLVSNMRSELTDARDASTVTTVNGQPAVQGCAHSFQFDTATDPNYLTDLSNGKCVPVIITMTHSGAATISASNGSNSNIEAEGNTRVEALQYCDPTVVASSANITTYTGELYITQMNGNESTLGALANEAMGAGYGPRQFVTRVAVGLNAAGTVATCNAGASSQVNGNNCTQAGMYYNPTTQQCQIYLSKPGVTTQSCNPLTQFGYYDTAGQRHCADIRTVCSDGGGNVQNATVASALIHGNLICDRPRFVPPNVTNPGTVFTPNPTLDPYGENLTTTPTTTGGLAQTNNTTTSSAITDTSGNPVSGTNGANINTTATSTSSVPSQCQAALASYIDCLTAKNIISGYGSLVHTPNCTALSTAVCPATSNSESSLTSAQSSAASSSSITNIGAATTYPSTTGAPASPSTNTDCSCGLMNIAQGEYCGYCAVGASTAAGKIIDAGYGVTQYIESAQMCDNGVLVPQPVSSITNASTVKCGYYSLPQPIVPVGSRSNHNYQLQ